MLSAAVFTPPTLLAKRRSGALVRSLAALVPAIVDGVVRDVTLLQVGEADDVRSVADEAGCRTAVGDDFADGLARAAAEARSAWVLVLVAGAAPTRLFSEEASRALEDAAEAAGGIVLRERVERGLGRWLPGLAPAAGVMLRRATLAEGRCAGFAEVLRRARPARALPTPAPVHR